MQYFDRLRERGRWNLPAPTDRALLSAGRSTPSPKSLSGVNPEVLRPLVCGGLRT
ncbi:MAG: hypothetical protein J6L64_03410 [Opitutales bacterium]|nr:hypothetical protein [Opitutales bacterium]